MFYISVIALIISIDFVSKLIINKNVKEGQKIEIAKGNIYITNVKNTGGAGGLFKDDSEFLSLLSYISLGNLAHVYFNIIKREEKSAMYKLSFACILGGAIGNILERLRKKSVTDFIFFKYRKKTISPKYKALTKFSPIFNAADFFIIIGIILFIIRSIFSKKKRK